VAHHAGTKSAQASANEQAQNQQIADQQAQMDAMQSQQLAAAAPPPQASAPAAPAAPAVDPTTAQLQNLANLHAQGVLTDEEYAAAKAKALGI
jgi:hemolysin activation/secretion protein